MDRVYRYKAPIWVLVGLFVGLADYTRGESLPRITIQPSDWQQYEGAGASLRVTAQSESPIAYQWFKNGEALPGATNLYHSVSPITKSDAGNYHVTLTNASGTIASKQISGEVFSPLPPHILKHPVGQDVDFGDDIRLTVSLRTQGTTTYQWFKDNELIASGTFKSTLYLTIDNDDDLGTYHVEITNPAGSVTSNAAEITRSPPRPPEFSTHPPAMIRLRPGQSFEGVQATINSNRPGTREVVKDGEILAGSYWENSLSYTPLSVTDSGIYQIRFSTETHTALSAPCVVIVDDEALPRLISRTSGGQTAEFGSQFSIEVQSEIATGLAYQWFHNGTPITGADSREFVFTNFAIAQIGDYTVRVTAPGRSETSAPIRVNIASAGQKPYFRNKLTDSFFIILANADLGAARGEKPMQYQWMLNDVAISRNDLRRVELQPEDNLVLVATNRWGSTISPPVPIATGRTEPVVFVQSPADTITSAGNFGAQLESRISHEYGASYQWFRNGVALGGYQHELVSFYPVRAEDAGVYYVEVTNDLGTYRSSSATLEVMPVPGQPVFTLHPQSQAVPAGSSVTFTAAAESDSGEVSYQWHRYPNDIPGATDSSLTLNSVGAAEAGFYVVTASTPTGSMISKSALLTIATSGDLYFVSHPQPATVRVGESVEFSVEVSGNGPLTYQWRDRLQRIVGTNSPTLRIERTGLADYGHYYAVVTDGNETIASERAELVVESDSDFFFSTNPASQTLAAGDDLTLRAFAESRTPFVTYQWYHNNVPLSGETQAELARGPVALAHAGDYHVTATLLLSVLHSTSARITVIPPDTTPTFRHSVIGRTYVPGESITLLNRIELREPLASLNWAILLPAETSLLAVESTSGISPTVGTTDLAEWSWTNLPAGPITFTYELSTSANFDTHFSLTGLVSTITPDDSAAQYTVLPDPLVVPLRREFHAADANENRRIDLSELLAVIELYNARRASVRTGRYTTGDDGTFRPAPDETRLPKRLHTADLNHNGQISLSELLRMIELYNTRLGTVRTGAYRSDLDAEDGFRPDLGD